MRYRQDFTVFPRTLQSGAVVWYYRTYDASGRRQAQRSTGIEGDGKRVLAERYCNRLLKEGKLAAPVEREPTLRDWAASRHWWVWTDAAKPPECAYLRARLARSDPERPGVTRGYANECLRTLEAHILPAHGDRKLVRITPGELEALLFKWLDEGVGRKTVNNRASVYRIMLKEARRLGEISRNPWVDVQGLRVGGTSPLLVHQPGWHVHGQTSGRNPGSAPR